jgi:tRNA pseudouridine65 synthase
LWLHAHALTIAHPRTGEVMQFCADWRQLGAVPEVQQWQQLLSIAGWTAAARGMPPSCGITLPSRASDAIAMHTPTNKA